MKFGLLTDIQYADVGRLGSRYYRNSLKKLDLAVSEFERHSLQFIIQLGDLIDRNKESVSPVREVLKRIDVPIYHVLGNHDFYGSINPRQENVFSKLEIKKRYYNFSLHNWRFVVLDGMDLSTLAHPPDHPNAKQAAAMIQDLKKRGSLNAQVWNGGIGKEQKEWLRGVLQDALSRKQQVLLFCHFPLYPENVHNLLNDSEMLEILDTNPAVFAWFNGHNHDGHYGFRNSVHHVTFKGMVKTSDENSFAIVELFEDRIEIRGFGREITQSLGKGSSAIVRSKK
ncbi:metallophosphoesterase [Acidobacteriota bacterium]